MECCVSSYYSIILFLLFLGEICFRRMCEALTKFKTDLFQEKVNLDAFRQRNRFLAIVLGAPQSISALFRSFQVSLGSVLVGVGSVLSGSGRLQGVSGRPKTASWSHLRPLREHPCYSIVWILVAELSRRPLLKDVSNENITFRCRGGKLGRGGGIYIYIYIYMLQQHVFMVSWMH